MSHSTAQASSAAAPLAEPPASPPATGMDFLIDRLTPSESPAPCVLASSRAARMARLVSSQRHQVGALPGHLDLEPSGSAHGRVTSSKSETAW